MRRRQTASPNPCFIIHFISPALGLVPSGHFLSRGSLLCVFSGILLQEDEKREKEKGRIFYDRMGKSQGRTFV